MADRELMKGNEALGEAAIRAGCLFYYGYPITPQTELLEYMAHQLPKRGGTFLQTESEVATIYYVYGTASTGKRVMTASSSPGISLMAEGMSFLAAAQLPAVVVDIARASPGLGRIPPAQSDYRQLTHGAGHGDYQMVVLAPATVQEMADLAFLAFDLADRYRNPVAIMADGMLGQMMEPLEWKPLPSDNYPKEWALTGASGRPRNIVLNAPYTDAELIELNRVLKEKYHRIAEAEQRWEYVDMDGAELAVVAYGTSARVAMEAVKEARKAGIPAGLIRPISLWPFPVKAFQPLAGRLKGCLTVEMNGGQMVDDVELAVRCTVPVHSYGQGGGWIPNTAGVREEIERVWRKLQQ
ncbi:MAG: 3-methyl-2-oxobutanoate dehydrogenase subunit VorB [Actinobacteria bacterium]|nr:3-methyl-2-oxobutanoate dehydrogenase subunit VorB [Actinomycetota bacterium]